MASDKSQRKLYQFLCDAYMEHRLFTALELEETTGWAESTFRTYYEKQFKGLLAREDDGTSVKYRVTDSFLRYPTFERFRELVTQVRRGAEDFTLLRFGSVVIYDFFMPLSNEGYLKRVLNTLFFKDTTLRKLRRLLRAGEMENHFPRNGDESDGVYLERVLQWVDSTFGGYSITHVSGRYKAYPMMTASDAGSFFDRGGSYLVDETTAVVRFVFPCGSAQQITPGGAAMPCETALSDEVLAEADRIGWFFWSLFVEGMINAVSGQDEVWMLESGLRNRLYVWKVASAPEQ